MEKRRVKVAIPSDKIIWTLVKFVEDGWYSHPIKLHELENEETGEDGMVANLQEGDLCLAPYDSQQYLAKILKLSSDKESILRDRNVFVAGTNTKGKKTAGKRKLGINDAKKSSNKKQTSEKPEKDQKKTNDTKGNNNKQKLERNEEPKVSSKIPPEKIAEMAELIGTGKTLEINVPTSQQSMQYRNLNESDQVPPVPSLAISSQSQIIAGPVSQSPLASVAERNRQVSVQDASEPEKIARPLCQPQVSWLGTSQSRHIPSLAHDITVTEQARLISGPLCQSQVSQPERGQNRHVPPAQSSSLSDQARWIAGSLCPSPPSHFGTRESRQVPLVHNVNDDQSWHISKPFNMQRSSAASTFASGNEYQLPSSSTPKRNYMDFDDVSPVKNQWDGLFTDSSNVLLDLTPAENDLSSNIEPVFQEEKTDNSVSLQRMLDITETEAATTARVLRRLASLIDPSHEESLPQQSKQIWGHEALESENPALAGDSMQRKRSPRKKVSWTAIRQESHISPLPVGDSGQLRRSPRKKVSKTPYGQNEVAVLITDPSFPARFENVKVDKIAERKALLMARGAKQPVVTLLNGIMSVVFTEEELAVSSGLGLRKMGKDKISKPLDSLKMDAIREYLRFHARREGWEELSNLQFNHTVANKVGNARRRMGKKPILKKVTSFSEEDH